MILEIAGGILLAYFLLWFGWAVLIGICELFDL